MQVHKYGSLFCSVVDTGFKECKAGTFATLDQCGKVRKCGCGAEHNHFFQLSELKAKLKEHSREAHDEICQTLKQGKLNSHDNVQRLAQMLERLYHITLSRGNDGKVCPPKGLSWPPEYSTKTPKVGIVMGLYDPQHDRYHDKSSDPSSGTSTNTINANAGSNALRMSAVTVQPVVAANAAQLPAVHLTVAHPSPMQPAAPANVAAQPSLAALVAVQSAAPVAAVIGYKRPRADDANPELMPTFPALPMPRAGHHLASIEKRITGMSFEHEPVWNRLKRLENEMELDPTSDMSIKKRIDRIEKEAISMAL
jgi:hypothetical protein